MWNSGLLRITLGTTIFGDLQSCISIILDRQQSHGAVKASLRCHYLLWRLSLYQKQWKLQNTWIMQLTEDLALVGGLSNASLLLQSIKNSVNREPRVPCNNKTYRNSPSLPERKGTSRRDCEKVAHVQLLNSWHLPQRIEHLKVRKA